MKLCIVKNIDTGLFFGRQYDEGYAFSERTYQDPSVDVTWKPLKFFLGTLKDCDENCGLIIFESKTKAEKYMKKEWSFTNIEIVNIADIEDHK